MQGVEKAALERFATGDMPGLLWGHGLLGA